MNNIENILYECKNDGMSVSEAEYEICEIIAEESESSFNQGFDEGWDDGYEEARHEFGGN